MQRPLVLVMIICTLALIADVEHSTRFWRVVREGLAEDGWTDLPEFLAADSRIVYLSADGDDEAASRVYGRGYYLPGDPEIGGDPTLPAVGWQQIQAYASFEQAKARMRNQSGNTLDGEPDWLLIRRGDTFDLGESGLVTRNEAGRSPEEPRVYSAYGPLTEARPILRGLPHRWIESWNGGNWIAASLEFAYPDDTPDGEAAPGTSFSIMYDAANILMEDLRFPQSRSNVIQLGPSNIVIRRCVFQGNWSGTSHVQGLYVNQASHIILEECVFDLNGYKEDPLRPATWTRDVNGGDFPPGEGVQPRRTFHDRNLYLANYSNLRLLGNLISRGGGGGSVQMRVGGLAERNAFLFNESALVIGHSQADRGALHNGAILDNLVLHDDHMLPPGGFGNGLFLMVGENQSGVLSRNIVAHFHRINNAGSALVGGGGIEAHQQNPAQRAGNLRISENIAITTRHNRPLFLPATTSESGVQNAEVTGNTLAVTQSGRAASSGDLVRAPTVLFNRNRYHAAPGVGFQRDLVVTDFTDWQEAGYDSNGAFFDDLEPLAESAGWLTARQLGEQPPAMPHGWERDIISYMRHVDPAFEPNENVTVDAGVPAIHRRPDAPRVWEVLHHFRGFPHDHATRPPMSEEEAKLAARRYHAFLTFIERAANNRRGAWDPAYTAESLNNYMRSGFGWPPVRGPYSAELP